MISWNLDDSPFWDLQTSAFLGNIFQVLLKSRYNPQLFATLHKRCQSNITDKFINYYSYNKQINQDK